MTTKLSRRAAFGALAGAAAVPAACADATAAVSANGDPYVAALAKLREACDARDAEACEEKSDEEYNDDRFQVLYQEAWDTFDDVMETEPVTAEGHAARLEFLALTHPCMPEGMVCHIGPECTNGYDEEDYAQMIHDALFSAAALLRRLAKA